MNHCKMYTFILKKICLLFSLANRNKIFCYQRCTIKIIEHKQTLDCCLVTTKPTKHLIFKLSITLFPEINKAQN